MPPPGGALGPAGACPVGVGSRGVCTQGRAPARGYYVHVSFERGAEVFIIIFISVQVVEDKSAVEFDRANPKLDSAMGPSSY